MDDIYELESELGYLIHDGLVDTDCLDDVALFEMEAEQELDFGDSYEEDRG